MEGAVYEWNTLTSKRESESVLKSCSYTSVTISPDAKTIFAVGTDCTLKEIQACQVRPKKCYMLLPSREFFLYVASALLALWGLGWVTVKLLLTTADVKH